MAAPLMLAYAGLAGLQVWSGLQQAQMIRRNAEIQQQVNDLNASYAEIDAYNAELAGEAETAAYQTEIDQTASDQKVAMAAQNIDVGFGTAKELQEETRVTGFMNQLKMRQQARAKALGYRMEASNIRLGGQMNRSQADMNAWGAKMGGIVSAIGTGVSAYSRNK